MSKFIPLILFTVLTNFGSQILLKHGMTTMPSFQLNAGALMKVAPQIIFNPWVILGLAVMVVSMASHLVVLSRVDISYAYPFLGLFFLCWLRYGDPSCCLSL